MAVQAAPEATGQSVACESGVAKAAETVAARLCRTEERGGACPPPPVHVVAPLHYAASSYFFLLAVYVFQATKEEAPVAWDWVAGDTVAGNSVAGDSVAGDSVAGDLVVAGDTVVSMTTMQRLARRRRQHGHAIGDGDGGVASQRWQQAR